MMIVYLIWEVGQAIKKLKRRNAPGPDEIPNEVFKEMDTEHLELVRELLNKWWTEEHIPDEVLRARVVLI